MKPRVCRVDDDGLEVVGAFPGSVDVHFDGWRGWSAAIDRVSEEPFVVPWPKRLRPWLDGVSQVSVTHEGEQLFDGEVSFGSGTGRVELVDRHGTQIIIDKWGLQQRPFEVRRAGGAVEMMTQKAEQVLEVMRRDCGIDGWISFGTLLGAARSGAVIGHDSDIDLCFLSERATPAEMIAELWSIARALTDAGIQVKHKSASFITVVYEAPDGGMDGIDIYTCFYVGDLLYETATVRAPVPRSAIMPLRQLEFEGRLMPAPADPDQMLTVSYGPGWKVPDPSFRHQPDSETTERFHDWFGSLMTHRRDWASVNTAAAAKHDSSGSSFARWVTGQLEGRPRVLDIGSGSLADVRHYAAEGYRALAYDFAHPGRGAAGGRPIEALPEGASRRNLNLLDLRDVLTSGAVAARASGPRVVCARRLLESVEEPVREAFWRFTSMALRPGGQVYLEGMSRSRAECRRLHSERGIPRVLPLDPAEVEVAARAAGGTVVLRENFTAAARSVRSGSPTRWRMVVEWPTPASAAEQIPTTEQANDD
ncbi:hypothetical protein [Nocardioides sp. 616]|uniref:hypothetical protein n=1 Tax=Nocardioides sp. 616 TaxID=2268090 RepID=UPI000CE49B89|nr:hypothetical protein [Nocardioides sp. 616]